MNHHTIFFISCTLVATASLQAGETYRQAYERWKVASTTLMQVHPSSPAAGLARVAMFQANVAMTNALRGPKATPQLAQLGAAAPQPNNRNPLKTQ